MRWACCSCLGLPQASAFKIWQLPMNCVGKALNSAGYSPASSGELASYRKWFRRLNKVPSANYPTEASPSLSTEYKRSLGTWFTGGSGKKQDLNFSKQGHAVELRCFCGPRSTVSAAYVGSCSAWSKSTGLNQGLACQHLNYCPVWCTDVGLPQFFPSESSYLAWSI